MSEFVQITLTVALFRSITILCGLGALYMGYRLFTLGVYERAGELKAAWGDRNLLLKQAAPGTFFALFGTAIIVFGIQAGLAISRTQDFDDSGRMTEQVVLRSIDVSGADLIDQRYKSGEIAVEQAYEDLYSLVTRGGQR